VWRPHFYVSIKRAEPASFEVIVNHDNITDITTYLRLCSRPHKRKYEAISMMLSWLMHEPHGGSMESDQVLDGKDNDPEGKLLFVLLQNLAHCLEQRVLRPLDRPILFGEGDLAGLQRR